MKAAIPFLTKLFLALVLSAGAVSLPASTLKLNLEIQRQTSSDLCSAGSNHDLNYRITNNDSVSVDLATLTVVQYFDSDITISVASCGAWASNATTGLFSAVGCAVASGPTCTLAGKKANQSVTLSFGSLAIAPGQVVSFQAQIWRGGFVPFDVGCDNYSNPGTSTAWNNNSGYLLFQSGSLVCEYSNSSTQDAASGVAPCSGANGCAAVASPTPTIIPSPSASPTAVPGSPTATPSVSPSPSTSPTISPSATRSPTPSVSPTFTASPTAAPGSPTVSPTPQMRLIKSADRATAILGDTITYSIQWQNDSNGSVTYPISDALASTISFLGCDSGCSHSGQNVSWSFSAGPNSSGTVKVWVQVASYP